MKNLFLITLKFIFVPNYAEVVLILVCGILAL